MLCLERISRGLDRLCVVGLPAFFVCMVNLSYAGSDNVLDDPEGGRIFRMSEISAYPRPEEGGCLEKNAIVELMSSSPVKIRKAHGKYKPGDLVCLSTKPRGADSASVLELIKSGALSQELPEILYNQGKISFADYDNFLKDTGGIRNGFLSGAYSVAEDLSGKMRGSVNCVAHPLACVGHLWNSFLDSPKETLRLDRLSLNRIGNMGWADVFYCGVGAVALYGVYAASGLAYNILSYPASWAYRILRSVYGGCCCRPALTQEELDDEKRYSKNKNCWLEDQKNNPTRLIDLICETKLDLEYKAAAIDASDSNTGELFKALFGQKVAKALLKVQGYKRGTMIEDLLSRFTMSNVESLINGGFLKDAMRDFPLACVASAINRIVFSDLKKKVGSTPENLISAVFTESAIEKIKKCKTSILRYKKILDYLRDKILVLNGNTSKFARNLHDLVIGKSDVIKDIKNLPFVWLIGSMALSSWSGSRDFAVEDLVIYFDDDELDKIKQASSFSERFDLILRSLKKHETLIKNSHALDLSSEEEETGEEEGEEEEGEEETGEEETGEEEEEED